MIFHEVTKNNYVTIFILNLCIIWYWIQLVPSKGKKLFQCQIRSISERRIDSYQSRMNKINRGSYQCEFQDKRDRILEQKKRSTFFSNSIDLVFSAIRNLAIYPYRARKHFLGVHMRLYTWQYNSKEKTLVLYIELLRTRFAQDGCFGNIRFILVDGDLVGCLNFVSFDTMSTSLIYSVDSIVN